MTEKNQRINTEILKQNLQEAANFIEKRFGKFRAEIAMTLGSGLGDFGNNLEDRKEIPYEEVPHLPLPSVSGHSGKIIYGKLHGRNVTPDLLICLAGRSHGYEGIEMFILNFVARLMAMLGVKIYIATNASGGSQPGMYKGCLMVITDHINFYKRNPLLDLQDAGLALEENADLSDLYSKDLRESAYKAAEACKIALFEGVYGATSGPSYETKAETTWFTELGASCFGMSTIPETMTAGACGMEVFGIALITNLAAGLEEGALEHKDVTDVASQTGGEFTRFMKQFLAEIKPQTQSTKPVFQFQSGLTLQLPQPRPLAPTAQEVAEAVSYAKKKLGTASLAISLGFSHCAVLSQLDQVQDLAFKDIPHFPFVLGTTEAHGRLSVGKLEGVTVLCLSGIGMSGLACEEAAFLAEVLVGLGVTCCLHSAPVGALDRVDEARKNPREQSTTINSNTSNVKLGQLFQLTDVLDTAGAMGIPKGALTQHLSHQLLSTAQIGNLEARSYVSFPGPSFPTPAECRVAKRMKANYTGNYNLPLLGGLAALGVVNFAVGETSWDSLAPKNSILKQKEDRSVALASVLKSWIAVARNLKAPSLVAPRTQFHRQQLSYNLQTPVVQGSWQETEQTSQFLRQKYSHLGTQKLAVFVAAELASFVVLEQYESNALHTIEYSTVPVVKDFCDDLVTPGKIFVCKDVIVFKGTFYHNMGLPADRVCFLVRLAKHLGVEKVFYCANFMAVDIDSNSAKDMDVHSLVPLRVGDLVRPTDHVSLTGRNPTFGHNEDRWGKRFYDAQDIYHPAWNFEDPKKFPGFDHPIYPTHFGHFTGPLFSSSLLARWLLLQPCQPQFLTSPTQQRTRPYLSSLSTGLAPESLAAHHLGLKFGALGVVTSSTSGSSGNVEFQKVVEMVQWAIEKLK